MINILNAGNKKVTDGLMITVLSLIKHTDKPINMICLTMDLSDIDKSFTPISNEFAELVNKVMRETNKESKFTLIDMSEHFKKELISSPNLKTWFTPYAMLRLLCDKVPMPDKFIYLDTDTVINRDISLLYDIDIEEYEIAGVKDDFCFDTNYFNSGVMLINNKLCKETQLFSKARELVNKKKMYYVDQKALNLCCTKKLMLPYVFNAKSKYDEHIVVHHFCNVRRFFFKRIKPWEVKLVKRKTSAYNDVLDNYLKLKKENPQLFFQK